MATTVRRLSKVALFIGLFLLSARHIGQSGPMTESEALRWLSIANGLGLHEADDVYIPVMLTAWLIVAAVAYIAIIKLWRYYRTRS